MTKVHLWDGSKEIGIVEVDSDDLPTASCLIDQNGRVFVFWNMANSQVNFLLSGDLIEITI